MAWISLTPQKLRKQILLVSSQAETPVWISGPKGAGKSKIAKWMHENSPRSHESFINVTPEQIRKVQAPIEFLMANPQSTYLLEEFEDHSEAIRNLFSEILKKKFFMNSQGQAQLFKGRLIVSASRTPQAGSELARVFKNSLFEILPLKDRMNEFDSILEVLWGDLIQELSLSHLKPLSAEIVSKLKEHDWPGNLRELRNALSVMMKSAQGRSIEISDVPKLD